jgi:hypothetical protein
VALDVHKEALMRPYQMIERSYYWSSEMTSLASIGHNVAVTKGRKFCRLNLDLDFSAGFQYAIYRTDYIGYADLVSWVHASVRALYYFSGDSAQVMVQRFLSYTQFTASQQTAEHDQTLDETKLAGNQRSIQGLDI